MAASQRAGQADTSILTGTEMRLPVCFFRIPRTIFEEVKRNLSPESFREFISFINALTTIDEDIVVPFEIAIKYEAKGLKPADAFIAAFTAWVGAEVLVTENRHFLNRHTDLPFEVLTAEECLKLI